MTIELPPLHYPRDALAPHLSAETIDFHYGKHHQAYVMNLNGLVKGTEFEHASLEDIVCATSSPVFNNAAPAWNHTFERPLPACDVREHAHYIDDRNARPSYVTAFWKLVNREAVGSRVR
ncbi:MAG TPA: Fe-Mn family superoxide dismutase [Steroidobacteraceae bacterium]|nr:Fe-Mn family superoxide dismutase [Steroidobacteraceae bacterium]